MKTFKIKLVVLVVVAVFLSGSLSHATQKEISKQGKRAVESGDAEIATETLPNRMSPINEDWWELANKAACRYAKEMSSEVDFLSYEKKIARKVPKFDWNEHYYYLNCTQTGTNIFHKMQAQGDISVQAFSYMFQRIKAYEKQKYEQALSQVNDSNIYSTSDKEQFLESYRPRLMELVNKVDEDFISGDKNTLLDYVLAAIIESDEAGEDCLRMSFEDIAAFMISEGATCISCDKEKLRRYNERGQ